MSQEKQTHESQLDLPSSTVSDNQPEIEKTSRKNEKKVRKKRTHKWTEANKKSFYEKCVPARLASLARRKELRKLQEQSVEA